MNLVARTAKKSPRLVVITLFIALTSSIAAASRWDHVTAFVRQSLGSSLAAPPESAGAETLPAALKTPVVDNKALAPLVGTYSIPGDYTDLAAAITDLNTQGVGGAVTLNLLAGNPQTSPAGGYVIGGAGALVLTTTSAANTVTIQGNGNTITAPATHTAGALNDALFKIVGADWITVAGFTMQENAANTTTTAGSNNMTEWGVALLYVTATDGAQNNTITGNTIDLNRTYQNTFGIYANATHTATSVSTSATATGAAGGSSGLTITANNITDVNQGIVVVGPTAAADHNDGVTIGGSAPNANTITNYGTTGTFSSYANVSGTIYGILVRNTKNYNISHNSITSSSGSGGVIAGTLRGIFVPAASNQPTGTFTNNINNNTLAVTSHVLAGGLQGITVESTTSSPTSTTNINNNNFTNLTHTIAAATGAITGISLTGSATAGPLNSSISGNTFTNITSSSTGSFTFISNSFTHPAGAVTVVNNNSIATQFTKSGAGGTVFFYDAFGSTTTGSETNTGNNFSNMTFSGATTVSGWRSADGATPLPSKTVTNNTFNNISGGTGGMTILTVSFSPSATISGNTVSNVSGAGTITGITTSSGTQTFSQNTVFNLTGSGTGAVIGMSSTGGATQTFSKNKVYGISNTNAGGSASGITVSGGTTTNVQNNLVGEITAPTLNATNSLNGINISGGTTVTADFNTVYLNASSTGANFGSSALNASTTPNVTLRNNILVNTSTAAGTGVTAAYRRSSTTLTTYNPASNNNDFYAGAPGAANLIFFDGTNSDQSIAAFKARVAARDAASFSENPAFLSTTGANANFLHISAVTPTQLESGGVAVAGIADDFDGNPRNATTPDIGADEFTGVAIDLAAPAIVYSAFGNTTSTANRVLNAVISDLSGVAAGGNSPRLYFKKSTDAAYVSTQCMMTGGTPQNGTYECSIDNTLVGGGSVATGDIVQYFVVAQDTAGNVGANPGAGFAATSVNSVTSPPTTPNSYTIVAAFPASATVGAGGTYASLTNAGGLFEAMNASVFNGSTTIEILSDLTGETGAIPLNQLTEEGAGAGTFTVTIKPSGAARSINGSSANALIKLGGADRVMIDGSLAGGTDRSLTITNTGTGAIVWIATNASGGANNNSIRNTNLIGAGAFTGNGIMAGSGATLGTAAESGRPNSNNTIQNNSISRVQNAAFISGDPVTRDQNWSITQNDAGSATVADKLSFRGIFISGADNFTISQNRISGISSSSGTSSTMSGIQVAGVVSGGALTRNEIKDIRQNNTGGWGSNGIYLAAASTASNLLIANNFVSDIASQGFNGNEPADNGYGIVVEGTGGGYNIFNNTVVMNTNQTATTNITAALLIDDSATTAGAINLRNNILANTQTIGTNYSVYVDAPVTNTVFSAIDYNDYFTTENVGNLGGVVRTTLADWQTATGQDANSKADDPVFVAATDFHLQETSTLIDTGTAIAAVTNDFDGTVRPQGAGYEIGADEILAASNAGTIQFGAPTYSIGEAGGTVTLTVTRTGGTDGAVAADYALGGGTATGGAACAAGIDYVNTGGMILFGAGDGADKTFNVTICDDAVFEGSETFNATLSNPTGGATLGSPNPAAVTITENDAAAFVVNDQGDATDANPGDGVCQTAGAVCTLRAAVAEANALAGSETITFAPSVTLIQTGQNIQISTGMTITGSGANQLTVQNIAPAGFTSNIFYVYGAQTVNISGMTITGGNLSSDSGGGIFTTAATLNLTRVAVVNNRVRFGEGGGIENGFGTLNLIESTVSGNICDNSPASGNCGAGIQNYRGTVNIINSTVSGNSGIGTGFMAGGVYNFGNGQPSTVNVTNSTIANNSVTGGGSVGGIMNFPSYLVTVGNSIIANQNNATNPDVSGPFTSNGYNLIGNVGGAGGFGATGDQVGNNTTQLDPLLGALAFNGGPTRTHALLAGSPALDKGSAFGATTDQRGAARPFDDPNIPPASGGDNADIGAYESQSVQTPGTIQFSSAAYSVTEGTPTVTLTVTRAGGSSGAVTVNYTLGGGSATGGAACAAGIDYVNTGGSVSFADGDAADKTFNVTICEDNLFEGGEAFSATLSNPTGGATVGTPNPATVTITDNDSVPAFSIDDVTLAEGNSGTTNFVFTVTKSGATALSSSVDFATANGTAVAGTDYAANTGTLTFAAGDTTKQITVLVNGDLSFEANENFSLNLTNAINATISDAEGIGVINNDDAQPTVQFSSATYTNADDIAQNLGKGDEFAPQAATITVTRTGAAGNAFAVNYATVAGGTATGGASCGTGSGVDYVSTGGTLNFAAGELTKTFDVTVCTDNRFEGDETVSLTLASPTAPAILGTPDAAVLSITDNDLQPSLQFSSATYSNSDDVMKYGITTDEFAPQVATITVTRTGAVDNAVAVGYATSNGTATGGAGCTAGIDYVSASGTLNFAAGVISQTFNVTVCTDALFEGNETVNLTLSNPTGGAALGTPNSAVLTIVDNDAQPSLQFSSATYSVGEAGPTATVTVTRTGAPDNAVSVNYATVAGGTATGGASCGASVDYQNTSGTLSFAAGETSKSFNVPICDDASAESSETVNLALSSPSGGTILGTPSTAVLTITDNDAAPTLQFSSATDSYSEGAGNALLIVTRTGATGNTVAVDYATGGGTATAGACAPGVDYVATSGTLNFAAGETFRTISVTLCNDAVYELNQTFDVTLSNATGGATIGTPNTSTVTITNDDAAPTVAINDISQAEGNTGTTNFQTAFTVTGASEVAGGFNFQTADGTATAPSDYGAIAPTAAVIPANVNRTTATLNGSIVLVNGDLAVESDETFFLNGSSCTNCSFSDNQGQATITNDDTRFQFSSATYSVGEGAGTATITVTRIGVTNNSAAVTYSTIIGGSAAGGASCAASVDYISTSGSLNFGVGVTSQTFTVQICDDALVEPSETLNLGLFTPTPPAELGTPSSAVLTITDNDSDTVAPGITYTPVPSNSLNPTLVVTATDNIGVTGVTIFYSFNGGAFTPAACSFSTGSPANGTWNCTIAGMPAPASVAYYVTAMDGTNTTTNPTAGAAAPNLFTFANATVPAGSYTSVSLGNGVSLGGNVIVNGSLALTGIVNTGANKLTLNCGVAVIGGGEGSYVVGRLERLFCGAETFTFNVGAPFALPPVAPEGESIAPEGIVSNYSPLTVNITGGTTGSSLTVSATDAFMDGAVQVNSISRFWTLTENGSLTANLTFTYRNEDVVGTESSYNVLRRADGLTSNYPGGTVNAAANTFTAPNVSDFSDWSAGTAVPTAANAEIGGQVVTAGGEGIRNATVMLTGGNLNAPVYVRTGTFGRYRFPDLPVGQIYQVTVISKRYQFAEPVRIINLTDSVASENFIANPE